MTRRKAWFVIALAGGLLAPAPLLATDDGRPRPPPPETLDCKKDGNSEICVECGAFGISCCFDADCKVINEPNKPSRRAPTSPSAPVGPRPRLERMR